MSTETPYMIIQGSCSVNTLLLRNIGWHDTQYEDARKRVAAEICNRLYRDLMKDMHLTEGLTDLPMGCRTPEDMRTLLHGRIEVRYTVDR